jgi:hypothetical protein
MTATHLKRGSAKAPNDEDGRVLQSIAGSTNDRSSGCEDGALRHDAHSDEPPECDEQFAGHRDDRDPPRAPLKFSDASAELLRQAALRLIAQL